ncbi:unnamed protein product [Lactuca saligna]|uniref:F-box associated beta-propeller type 1 domain-containing protein n=1 Tax=Lactuca saligna TaxID=75948 RepID=A0AA36EBN9_LACSI|nr:unnamed protein product [Lactuca saligna]
MTMALHYKDDEQHRQQPERMKTLNSSGTSKDPQSVPSDIIIEILSRLPVKTLLRIRDRDLFIWNPSTRRSNRLPCSGSGGLPVSYNFGYDESSDDYKVVGIYYVYKGEAEYDATVKIYSLKTGNGKRIGEFHNGFSMDCCVQYLNGVLHWTTIQNSESSYTWTIASLDLAKETYGEILQPAYDEGYIDLNMGALRECLCVLYDHHGRNSADVWVMKVYGVKDSWTKLVSIPYPIGRPVYGFSVPLCISNDGKVLLQHGSELVVYDSKNCSSSEIQNFNEYTEPYTFVESLVSPDSRTLEIAIRLDIKEKLAFLRQCLVKFFLPSCFKNRFESVGRTD